MIESRIVEAACGECQFSMPGTGCDLAVRIDGQASFVVATGLHDTGDTQEQCPAHLARYREEKLLP